MNEREHMLDDSPLSTEKVTELKVSAEKLLVELEAANETESVPEPAPTPTPA